MIWKDYSRLVGSHAYLSASRYHWLNYDEEKLQQSFTNYQKVQLGTRMHKLAEDLIKLKVRLPDTEASFNAFVNDAIGFRMESERLLYYSANCYGTADAISYFDGLLRIHDLKTGLTPGSVNQLMIYAALFCLDYAEKPKQIVLRIYQNEEVTEFEPEYQDVEEVMEKIIASDAIIELMKSRMIV